MTSPALNAPLRSFEQYQLERAAALAKRTLRADQLPPDLFINVHARSWSCISLQEYTHAADAAEDAKAWQSFYADDPALPYRCTLQLLPDGSTRLLDLSEWAEEIRQENEQNARDDERHNRTLSSQAMGAR